MTPQQFIKKEKLYAELKPKYKLASSWCWTKVLLIGEKLKLDHHGKLALL